MVWKGRPSIGPYVALYGLAALVTAAAFVGAELWLAFGHSSVNLLRASLVLGSFSLPYGAEVVTAAVVFIGFLAKLVGLLIVRFENSYELRTDGLYVSRGIANLQDTFLSAMAFSDARLIRSLGMRIVGRSLIVVEANDGRRFQLRMIKNGLEVQSLIRRNLAHPTVRLENPSPMAT